MVKLASRRGFTLLELIIVILLGAGLLGILLPALGRSRSLARQIKCSANVRGMHQGLVLFAQNNNEEYPLPSKLDKANNTMKLAEGEDRGLKDQSKNIVSCLIFNTFFGPEICVSPAESNPDIEADKDFEYSEPQAAVNRKLALWDPRFKGPPSPSYQGCRAEDKGNLSYAHSMPFGGRLKTWSNTFNATETVLGNRGPWYTLNAKGNWDLSANQPVDAMPYTGSARSATTSNTLLIHGGRNTWEGNICYNDNHVGFETSAAPESLPFTFTGLEPKMRTQMDNIFADEDDTKRTPGPDSLAGDGPNKNTNNYLRMYAGGAAAKGQMLNLKSAWFAD